jgi:nitroreductase
MKAQRLRKDYATMNERTDDRRAFLKQGALLGGGLLLAQTDPRATAAPGQPANETLKTIASLRTIHGNFLDKEIPPATIQQVLQASIRAANASNNQSYSIIVVKDRALMQQVCTYRGSCMLLYCVDYRRMKASAESLGHPYFPDNVVNFVTASINAAFAAQTAVIAARSLGLDCLTTNGIHRGDMERVWTLLDLPQTYCFPLIAVVLGYPTQEPAYRMGRLDGAGVVHEGKYQRLTKDQVEEITRKYDDSGQHLGLDDTWKAQGYKHYLDWYFQVRAGSSKPTEKETQMLRLLKRSGFVEPHELAAIPDTEPKVTEHLRAMVQAASEGRMQPEDYTPEFWQQITSKQKEIQADLNKLGGLLSMTLVERRAENGTRRYRYRIEFQDFRVLEVFVLNMQGKVSLIQSEGAEPRVGADGTGR